MPIEGFRPCCMHVQHAESSSLLEQRGTCTLLPTVTSYLGERKGGRERILFVRDSSLYRFERGLPFFSSQIFPSPVDMISGDTRSCRDGYDFFVCKPSCFFKIVECSMFSSLSENAFITRNFFSPLIEIGKIFFLQMLSGDNGRLRCYSVMEGRGDRVGAVIRKTWRSKRRRDFIAAVSH